MSDQSSTHKSVAVECDEIYKENLSLLDWCRKNPDEEIVNECIVFCNINIEKLKLMKKYLAKTGGQKQACLFTINLLQSILDDYERIFVKEGGNLVSDKQIKWLDSEVAFDGAIRIGIIKNLSHVDPKFFFNDAKSLFVSEMNKTLKTEKCNLKVYTVLETTYERQKGDESVEELKHFSTKAFPIYIISNLKQLFIENIQDPTLTDMEEFQQRESGWTLKRIELLNVIISKFNPQRCGCFISLPKAISDKRACINIINSDDECFKWSVVSALAHLKGYKINNPTRIQTYGKYENEFYLNFSGIDLPMDINDIPKFEQQNNLSINLYIL